VLFLGVFFLGLVLVLDLDPSHLICFQHFSSFRSLFVAYPPR